MINFKSYLIESRSAPLYHGTTSSEAEDIIRFNIIQGRTPQDSPIFAGKKFDRFRNGHQTVYGVSLSRSFDVSRRFGHVVFQLNQEKLSQTHKIVPFQWLSRREQQKINQKQVGARTLMRIVVDGGRVIKHHDNRRTEAEEFVLGSIKNLDRFLEVVWVEDSMYNFFDHPLKRKMSER